MKNGTKEIKEEEATLTVTKSVRTTLKTIAASNSISIKSLVELLTGKLEREIAKRPLYIQILKNELMIDEAHVD